MNYMTTEELARRLTELEGVQAIHDANLATVRRQLRREQVDGSTALQSYSVTPEQLAPIPAVSVTQTTPQTILDAAWTDLTFQTQEYGTTIGVSLPLSSITAPLSGVYLVAASAAFDPNTVGDRAMRVYGNGVILAEPLAPAADNAAYGTGRVASMPCRLAAGQAAKAMVFQDSGGALNMAAARLTLTWLGN